jgi:hypothetical protein
LFIIGDELKQTVSIVVDLASVFDPDGVDIYFLNREPMFHVQNSEQLIPVFAVPPAGVFENDEIFLLKQILFVLLNKVQRQLFRFFDVYFMINNMK